MLVEGNDKQQVTSGWGLAVLHYLHPQVAGGKQTRRMGTRTHPSDSLLPGATLWGKGKLSPHQSLSGKKKKKKAGRSLKEGHGGLGQQLQLPGYGNNSEGQRTGKGKSRKEVGI